MYAFNILYILKLNTNYKIYKVSSYFNFLLNLKFTVKLPQTLTARTSGYMHAHTLYSMARPYGCSALIGSWDTHSGANLYLLEPSGVNLVGMLATNYNELNAAFHYHT